MTVRMTNDAIRAELRAHLAAVAGVEPGLPDDADLIQAGAIASMDLLALVAFVSDRFAIEIDQADIYEGRLASVASIAALIEERA
jgi:acyl carrier protein